MTDFMPKERPTTVAGWLALVHQLQDRDDELFETRAPMAERDACQRAILEAVEGFVVCECRDLTDVMVKLDDVMIALDESDPDYRLLQSLKRDLPRLMASPLPNRFYLTPPDAVRVL